MYGFSQLWSRSDEVVIYLSIICFWVKFFYFHCQYFVLHHFFFWDQNRFNESCEIIEPCRRG